MQGGEAGWRYGLRGAGTSEAWHTRRAGRWRAGKWRKLKGRMHALAGSEAPGGGPEPARSQQAQQRWPHPSHALWLAVGQLFLLPLNHCRGMGSHDWANKQRGASGAAQQASLAHAGAAWVCGTPGWWQRHAGQRRHPSCENAAVSPPMPGGSMSPRAHPAASPLAG